MSTVVGISKPFKLREVDDLPKPVAAKITSMKHVRHSDLGSCAELLITTVGGGRSIRLVLPQDTFAAIQLEIDVPF